MAQGGTAVAAPRRRGRGALVFVAIVVILAIVVVLLSGVLGGGEAVGATVSVVRSALETQKGTAAFQAAIDGDVLASGDKVRADDNGRGFLTFFDGSTVEVEPSTQLAVAETTRGADGSVVIRLEQTLGRTWINVQKFTNPNSRFEVKTPAATAVVRGTLLELIVAANGALTVRVDDGQVVVEKVGVPPQAVTAGFDLTTPPPGPEPLPPPVRRPPAPGLRFTQGAGTLLVRDPRDLSCGSGRSEIPRCREGSVIIEEPVPGEYVALLSTPQPTTLTVEALVGEQVVGTVRAQSTSAGMVRTSLAVRIEGGRPVLGQLAAFEVSSSACGLEVKGRSFEGGKFEERLKLVGQVPSGQTVAFVATGAELTASAQDALKQAKGLPVQVSDVKVSVSVRGLRVTANVAAGPVTVPGSADIIAGAERGRLVLKVRGLNLGPAPAAVVEQFKTQLEQNLAPVGKDLPLDVERVAFRDDARDGCFVIIGKKR